MQKVLLIFITTLLVQSAAAQPIPRVPSRFLGQAEGRRLTPEQAAELEEATRLSAKVVELHKEAKYDEALALAKRVVEIRRRILGNYDGRTAAALLNLAELYMAKREYGQARTLYEELLSTYEKTFGADHINNTIIIDSLALLNYLKGDHKRAERFYMQSLSVREKALGSEHAEVGEAVYKLAEFYRSRGDYSKAEPLFLRAIRISDKAFSADSTESHRLLERYVCFIYESKTEKEAVQLEEKLSESRNPKTFSPNTNILNAQAINLPRPEFPKEASDVGASGVVRVLIDIDEVGNVTDARVLCGHPIFAKPAEQAARRAKFSPMRFSGKPVKVKGILIYRFVGRGLL